MSKSITTLKTPNPDNTYIGQKLKGSFLPGVVLAKGCEFLLVFLGEGFGVGFRGVVGAVFLWKMREKGKGVGRVGRYTREIGTMWQIGVLAAERCIFLT